MNRHSNNFVFILRVFETKEVIHGGSPEKYRLMILIKLN